ncbi:hypothetical protein ILUMI_12663 [Ignelater luminosus]|uniref:Uncharacterized protein n=1 Tax=Ignelater luminosus TaxID=2038154 RepID=A0A8K0CW05_IGNLU|nr:hypothetical protein ILUMI_12663 [Ignelater luminosus]
MEGGEKEEAKNIREEVLKNKFGVINTTPRARRKKSRLNIEPGKSVIADTSSSSDEEHDLSEEHAENSTGSEEEDNDDII